jgi:hypothetical protein
MKRFVSRKKEFSAFSAAFSPNLTTLATWHAEGSVPFGILITLPPAPSDLVQVSALRHIQSRPSRGYP